MFLDVHQALTMQTRQRRFFWDTPPLSACFGGRFPDDSGLLCLLLGLQFSPLTPMSLLSGLDAEATFSAASRRIVKSHCERTDRVGYHLWFSEGVFARGPDRLAVECLGIGRVVLLS
jgi:hypothetical protein